MFQGLSRVGGALALAAVLVLAGPEEGRADADAGSQAPAFTAPTDQGSDLSLASLRGKKHVLLAFFPRAFTPG